MQPVLSKSRAIKLILLGQLLVRSPNPVQQNRHKFPVQIPMTKNGTKPKKGLHQ